MLQGDSSLVLWPPLLLCFSRPPKLLQLCAFPPARRQLRAGAFLGSQGSKAPPPHWAGFKVRTGARQIKVRMGAAGRVQGEKREEADEGEDGCHRHGTAGTAQSQASYKRQGPANPCKHKQLKRVLRSFGARAGFASERQPLSHLFTPRSVLQASWAEDKTLLL